LTFVSYLIHNAKMLARSGRVLVAGLESALFMRT